MNAQELFLFPPKKTKPKAQKASGQSYKIEPEQSNQMAGTPKLHLTKNTNTNSASSSPIQPILLNKQASKQPETNTKEQAKSAQSSLHQINDQDHLQKPHIKRCRQAIRSFCMECQGRLSHAVDACEDHDCKLYPFRKFVAESPDISHNTEEKPTRAVRQHCLICCGGERDEVRNCAAGKTCTLWPFRFGVNPTIYRKVKEKWRGPKHYTLPGL